MKLKILSALMITILLIAGFLGLAGRIDWFRGWAFVSLLIVSQTMSALYIWRKNPELLIRRSQIGKGTKTWDLILLALFGFTYLAILIVSALNARYHGAEIPLWLWPIGALLYAFFVVVMTWAMKVNPHFEKTVRIQHDRNHQVISTGPYRIVRHPGYTATLLGLVFATPLLLGSWWAFIPAVLAAVCLIIRTALEDQTLKKELLGYDIYTRKVQARLFPGLW